MCSRKLNVRCRYVNGNVNIENLSECLGTSRRLLVLGLIFYTVICYVVFSYCILYVNIGKSYVLICRRLMSCNLV